MNSFYSYRAPLALSVVGGLIWPLSLAPLSWWWLAPFSLGLFFYALRDANSKRVFWCALAYGVSGFAVGVSWVYASISNYSDAGVIGGVAITAIFVGGLALVQSVLWWVSRRWVFSVRFDFLELVFTWVLIEWLRGWILSGFPWLYLGYGAVDTPLQDLLPYAGAMGVTAWWGFLVAGLGILIFDGRRRGLGLLLSLVLCSMLALQKPVAEPLAPIEVGLVQANVPQDKKWVRSYRQQTLNTYLDATTTQLAGVPLVVWPETAIPAFEHEVYENFVGPMARLLKHYNMTVMTGVPVMNLADGRYFNAVAAYGKASGHYYKTKLVPFTEFIPFASWLDVLGVPMATFSHGEDEQTFFLLDDVKVGASVCYEVAYDFVMRHQAASNLLVTVSNDAWFGNTFAPYQHLQIARTRAVELGRPMVRATNTGISAFIDHQGEVQQTLGLNQSGVLRQRVVPMEHHTFYATYGNAPLLILLSLMGLWRLWARFYCSATSESSSPKT